MNRLMEMPLLQRLGVTLLHSLWEILVVALVARIGLDLLRGQRASLRYGWAWSCHLAMALAPILTFFALNDPGATEAQATLSMSLPALSPAATPVLPGRSLLHPLAPGLPIAALTWMIGAAIMLGRLGSGILWTRRARALACEAPASLANQVSHLAHRMGLSGSPGVRVLAGLDSPLVAGWWRPVLLMPAGALLHLPPEALEAVLAHELAHLARRDPWAVLLQSLIDVLLHFHPAAWWLSRRVRELREHACDDHAVALTGDPAPLAEGLAVLALLRHPLSPAPEPAPAAVRGPVMSRIHRLLNPAPTHAAAPWGLLLTLAATAAFPVALLAQTTPPKKAKTPKAATPKVDATGVADFDFTRIKVKFRPPTPPYPTEAKAQKIQGTVVVELTIDQEGKPLSAKAISGPEALKAAAEAFAQDWRFEPARLNGKPTQARFKLTMPFRLKGQEGKEGPEAAAPRPPSRPVEGAVHDTTLAAMKVISKPKLPDYPAFARMNKIQGTVVVDLVIDREGNPLQAKAVEGPEQLREVAEAYAMGWRFAPPMVDGHPVQARFKLVMPFRLQ